MQYFHALGSINSIFVGAYASLETQKVIVQCVSNSVSVLVRPHCVRGLVKNLEGRPESCHTEA